MKTLQTILLAVAALPLLAALPGCGGSGEQYGDAFTLTNNTELAVILTSPADHDGQSVKLEGEIVAECPSGCWFTLKDGDAVVHVDLAPHGIAIPQKVGSGVTVEGTVKVTDSRVVILGQGVELR